MKRFLTIALILVLILSAPMLSGCGKTEFGVTENTGKHMTIRAERARKDDFFMLGTLEVEDGEQIAIAADLAEGRIRVEILEAPESAAEITDTDREPILIANLHSSDGTTATMPAGNYLMKATCLEKASGSIRIDVQPVP